MWKSISDSHWYITSFILQFICTGHWSMLLMRSLKMKKILICRNTAVKHRTNFLEFQIKPCLLPTGNTFTSWKSDLCRTSITTASHGSTWRICIIIGFQSLSPTNAAFSSFTRLVNFVILSTCKQSWDCMNFYNKK